MSAARPILVREAEGLGETVFLVGLRHGRLRVLDKVEGSGFLRAAPGIGDVVPADITAAGKLYSVFGEGGDELSPAETREIANRGAAVNRDAWINGLSVLAVPVWQESGQGPRDLVAVLAVAAASPRFERLGEQEIETRLLAGAASIGERMSAGGVSRRHDRIGRKSR